MVVAAPLPLAHLTPWPDTAGAQSRLKESGIRIITIANFSPTLLRSNAENAGLIGFFDSLVSTDANHTYKPDPRAYRLDKDRLHLKKSDMLALLYSTQLGIFPRDAQSLLRERAEDRRSAGSTNTCCSSEDFTHCSRDPVHAVSIPQGSRHLSGIDPHPAGSLQSMNAPGAQPTVAAGYKEAGHNDEEALTSTSARFIQ